MKKNILIITDNSTIAKRFVKEVWVLVDKDEFELSFKCSPYSKPESFDLLGSTINIIDLKKSDGLKEVFKYDLIISLHCKQLFPSELTNKVRCINIHPGYLPFNRGWYPQVFSIINNTVIGATIHEINDKLDNGNIIFRDFVEKYDDDTSLTLYNRIVDKEIELLKKNITAILLNNYSSFKPEYIGKLFLKDDFIKLCELNLDKKVTMREVIDLLRALTHGGFKNAFFYNEKGEKIYVSIDLKNDSKN